ncbi:MAG: hypothetical protein R2941_04590 [Desulfobacterales bacterium]
MRSMEVNARVGSDGVLKVLMPEDTAGREIRIVMVFETMRHNHEPVRFRKTGWPEGFFDNIAGSLPDFPDIE